MLIASRFFHTGCCVPRDRLRTSSSSSTRANEGARVVTRSDSVNKDIVLPARFVQKIAGLCAPFWWRLFSFFSPLARANVPPPRIECVIKKGGCHRGGFFSRERRVRFVVVRWRRGGKGVQEDTKTPRPKTVRALFHTCVCIFKLAAIHRHTKGSNMLCGVVYCVLRVVCAHAVCARRARTHNTAKHIISFLQTSDQPKKPSLT